MGPGGDKKPGGGGGGGPLKKYVAERAAECVHAAHRLARDLGRAGSPERMAATHRALAAKAGAIAKTRELLEQMPKLLGALEAHIDSGLQNAALLPATEEALREDVRARSVRTAAAMAGAAGAPPTSENSSSSPLG